MKDVSLKWAAVITISSLATEVLVYSEVTMPVRPLITLWFLLICPGMAFVQLLQIRDSVNELVLAVALSLVLDLIVATAILYAGFWSPELILAILICLSLVGVLCQLFLWFRPRAGDTVGQL
jgi:hypothetical protein